MLLEFNKGYLIFANIFCAKPLQKCKYPEGLDRYINWSEKNENKLSIFRRKYLCTTGS